MAKRKKTKPIWWLIVVFAILILLALYTIANNNARVSLKKPLQQKSTEKATVSQENAIATVKSLPEVKDYLKRVPNALIMVNGEEDNAYMVQVYEIKNGHTATFNWYSVDKTTSKVEKQF